MIKKNNIKSIFYILLLFMVLSVNGQQRFPKPEFDTGYEQPSPTTPEPRAAAMEYIDLFVLFAVLSLATYAYTHLHTYI